MDPLALFLAVVLIALIGFMFYYHTHATAASTPIVTVAVPAAPSAASSTPPSTTETMIAAHDIARMTRGYNGLNTGGDYHDAITALHDAESMNLDTVTTGTRTL
jgi:hypothetical protein